MALAIAAALLVFGSTRVAASPGVWSIVASPNAMVSQGYIQSIAKVSSSEAWAVGGINSSPTAALIEHYSAGVWSTVANASPSGAFLYGVDVVSAADVWAVGDVSVGGYLQTLTEHYDGTAWSVVSSPNIFTTNDNKLLDVAVVGSSDVWAVGYAYNASNYQQPLTEHYTTAAGIATATSSTSLTQSSGTWAVNSQTGRTITAGITTGVVTTNTATVLTVASWTAGTPSSTAAYTLNGWAIVTSPSTNTTLVNELNGVMAVSASDVWAVGYAANGSFVNQTLTEHYTTAAGTATATSATSLTQSSATWAVNSQVGRTITAGITTGVVTANTATILTVASWTAGTPSSTAAYTLNGWAIVTSPSTDATHANQLNGVTVVSASELWAVGYFTGPSAVQNLTEHYTTAAGTATATSSTTLTDGSAGWAVNSQVGRTITAGITTGVVTANTATVLTVASWTAGTPSSTAAYTLNGWAIVTSPSTSATLANELNGVTVVSASDLWAAGWATDASAYEQTLTEHYTTAAGAATATSATSLTQSSATWAVNSQVGRTITAGITTGVVTANTATVLTVASWTAGTPTATAAYTLVGWAVVTSPAVTGTTWGQFFGVVSVSGSEA